jgi:diguanylate cyclase (GGDEF)-like protein
MKYKTDKSKLMQRLLSLLKMERKFNYFTLEINEILAYSRKELLYSKLLELFINLNFGEGEARNHWENIIKNIDFMKNHLNREIGLRVAIVDYFINHTEMMKEPIVVEMRVFKENEKLALVDSLTGLFNKRFYDITVRKEYKKALRFNQIFSLVLLDLDDFKQVNDTKGHLFGDEVLANFGKFLLSYSREEDIICRYGGEEFIVILPEITGDGALMYAERIRKIFKEDDFFKKHKITFSGGISTFPYNGKDLEGLFKSVDKSLYAAKYAGKDCIIKSTGNKRRFKRFNKSWKIQYQCLGDSFNDNKAQIEEVISQDISIGGLRFESKEELKIDSLILLKLGIPDNDESVISGKVLWVKRINKELFSYGVKFNDIDTKVENKLKKVLPDNFQNLSNEYYL